MQLVRRLNGRLRGVSSKQCVWEPGKGALATGAFRGDHVRGHVGLKTADDWVGSKNGAFSKRMRGAGSPISRFFLTNFLVLLLDDTGSDEPRQIPLRGLVPHHVGSASQVRHSALAPDRLIFGLLSRNQPEIRTWWTGIKRSSV